MRVGMAARHIFDEIMEDYSIIKNDRIRTKICNLMSDMLDNPDEYGIYPTGKFMSKMEDFCLELRYEAMGWTWAECCTMLDNNKDPREHDQANLIPDATANLDLIPKKESK